MTEPAKAVEPFLRWAGGKRHLLPELLSLLPNDFDLRRNRYFEPFLGGAALTWALAQRQSCWAGNRLRTPMILSDINPELTNTYTVVRDQLGALIEAMEDLAENTSEADFYAVRAGRPTDPVQRAARTIYLNQLAFNGLYRVNGAGAFTDGF